MMLTEMAAVPGPALPVQALKEHLRLGTGFEADGLQDGLVESCLRAALAAIEGRIGKALIARRFRLRLNRWRSREAQALPLAPVTAIWGLWVVAGDERRVVEPGQYRLQPDGHRPKLVARGGMLPGLPEGAQAELEFQAGFGGWADVPGDLAQAVLLLAAEFYETRHEADGRSHGLPRLVQGLIEPWRIVRMLGGGCA